MKNWLKVFFLFFVLGLLVYFNSLNNKFLIDDYVFLKNPVYSDAKFIFSQWNPYREQTLGIMDNEENLGYYRPMAHMVLGISYVTFKNNFWEYHLLNLFLFVFASSLIYLLIERITGNYNLAFLAGLFYLIHPINGIVVNYISASVFALQVIFMLGTILLLWESLERKNDQMLYALSLVFSFLSLFWNESGIMIPFYVGAFILVFRKDTLKNKVLYLFPYFLVILSYIVFRALFLGSNGNVLSQMASLHLTGGEYFASLFQVFAWYISKLFYPQGIVMQWVTPMVHDHIILNVLGLCLLFMIFLLLFIKFSKEKILRLSIIWALIGFAPVFLAAVMRPKNGAEIEPHWFIFSSIGFFIFAAYFFLFILERMKNIGFILLFILVFAWGAVSHTCNKLWADQKTYALYWAQQVPDFKFVFYTLADAYQSEGSFKESKKYYQMALSGYWSDQDIYNNVGVIDYNEGNLKEAELNYKRVLKINPHSSDAYNNLAALYLKEGQWKKANVSFRQALAYNPLLLAPRIGLAKILLSHAEYKKAIDLCMVNLNIVNNDTNTLLFLIDLYIQKKDIPNIRKYASHVINDEIDPHVLTQLGEALAQNNAPDLAMDCFTKVLRVAPDYKDAYLAAGALLANLGKYEGAIHLWTIGSTIDPSDRRFKQSMDKVEVLQMKKIK